MVGTNYNFIVIVDGEVSFYMKRDDAINAAADGVEAGAIEVEWMNARQETQGHYNRLDFPEDRNG